MIVDVVVVDPDHVGVIAYVVVIADVDGDGDGDVAVVDPIARRTFPRLPDRHPKRERAPARV